MINIKGQEEESEHNFKKDRPPIPESVFWISGLTSVPSGNDGGHFFRPRVSCRMPSLSIGGGRDTEMVPLRVDPRRGEAQNRDCFSHSCLVGADPGDGQERGSSDVMLSRDFFRRLVVSRPARPLLVDDGAAPPVGARADARRRVAGARVVVVMVMAVVDLADGSQLLAVVVLPPGLARSETHVDWFESG